MSEAAAVTSETLAYWFFRLNGCLTTVNFVLHPNRRGPQRTDADVLAVRFPHRSELADSNAPLLDDALFAGSDRVDVVIAEVKSGHCDMNGPWTERTRQNMQYVLNAIGILEPPEVSPAAERLYSAGEYRSASIRVRLFALGRERNETLSRGIVQVTWPEILSFVWDRFHGHGNPKADHSQWDGVGQRLWNLALSKSKREYVALLKAELGGA